MKADKALMDVVALCTKIDSKAAAIYYNFSNNAKDESLVSLWKEMSAEERGHVECWQRLSAHIEEGVASFIFDEPLEIKRELELIVEKVDAFLEESRKLSDTTSFFVIACNLELYMLHRSFVHMFYYMQSIFASDQNFGEEYGNHLSEFIAALNKYVDSPVIDVLGTAIQRLWVDNNDLVIQSNMDFLTSVFNRKGFFQTMTPLAYMAQRNVKNVGVMMIDADNFKKINDNYGHQAGDDVLRLIGRSLKNHVRQSDVVGRYGGEEFVVFLSDVQPEHLIDVAEKVRKSIEGDSKTSIPVTVSIGIAYKTLGHDADKQVEDLIKKADKCLYKAKNTGKNKVVGDY